MELLVDTANLPASHQFGVYEAALRERLAPFQLTRSGKSTSPFKARLQASRLGEVDMVHGQGDPHAIGQDRRCGSANPYSFGLVMALPGCVATQTLEDRVDVLEPGYLLLTDNNRMPGWLSFQHSMNVLTLQFPDSALPSSIVRHLASGPLVFAPGKPEDALLSAFVRRLPKRLVSTGEVDNVGLGSQLLGLLDMALRARGLCGEAADPRFDVDTVYCRAALMLIEQWLSEPSLSPARVAFALGISERHLYRVLAAHGMKFSQEVLSARLRRAALAVREPRMGSLTDVALACGFTNPSHFSRVFRDHFGCSPSEYRRVA